MTYKYFIIQMEIYNNELRMYIVVNSDAKMGKGKIAAQVGHVVMMITEYLLTHDRALYDKYKKNNMPKIVLKADLETMNRLLNISKFIVRDAGRNQIDAGTLTAIGFYL